MQKWTNTGAGPIQCTRFNKAWSKLNWENGSYVELTGVIGQSERRSVLTALGGSETRADVTAAEEAVGERFAWTITKENVNDVIKTLAAELEALQANRPVKDSRTTPTAEADRQAAYARMAADQKAKGDRATAAFVSHYGNGQKVTVQPGQVAVVAHVCFDNSDTMSDYFDRHASLSQSFALAIGPKQAETERLARRAVDVSPLLSSIPFDWHTEKWSMGHGNYLESKEGFELPEDLQDLRKNYGSGGGVRRAHWEVTFQTAYREPITLDAIAGYGQTQPTPEPDKPSKADGVTVTENDEKNGIEIRFPSKPSAETLDALKAAGWRWSRFSSCWYARRSDAARKFTESLSTKAEPGTSAAPATEPAEPTTEPTSPIQNAISARFRTWADALQPKIDHAGREMTQNPTPKRNREYQSRMHDCRNMERTQKALRSLADAHDAGTIPTELAGLETRDEISAMVRKSTTGGGGYYSVIESDDYADKSPTARILQSLIEGNSEQQAERERLRKIEALKAEIALSTIPGYFPTPAPVVSIMLDRAQLEPSLTILEPSAGSGNIADAIRADFPTMQIHCFELNRRLAELLKLKGHYLGGDDFLMDDQVARIYDRIIMNPPFEKQADIDHVRKAYSLLKPGGLLVSVMAPGFEFRQDRKSTEFRAWLDEVGGTWEDLPAESFKSSGTGVSTKLVIIPALTGHKIDAEQSRNELTNA
jgi:predicted RNA methylase